jgi:hypothetical protein
VSAERVQRAGAAFAAATLVGCVVGVAGILIARPYFRAPWIYPALGIITVAAAAVLARRRAPQLAAAIVVVASASYTAQQLVWMHGLSNTDVLAEMRYVHAATGPGDTIMDGFSGIGWFRPHAAYYWFVAPGVRPRLTAKDRAALVALLEDCRVGPRIVLLDDDLRRVSPDIAPTVARRFDETPYPAVWRRDSNTPGCEDKSPP